MSPHQQKNQKVNNRKHAIVRSTQLRIKRKAQHQITDSNLRKVNNTCFQLEVEDQTPQT